MGLNWRYARHKPYAVNNAPAAQRIHVQEPYRGAKNPVKNSMPMPTYTITMIMPNMDCMVFGALDG